MGSGCGPCSPLGGVALGRHRRRWVMGHGGEASSPLVVVRAIVGVDGEVLVGPRQRSCRRIVVVVVASGQHRTVVMRSLPILVVHRVVSSPGFVVDALCRVIHRCQNRVVSSSSVGGWVRLGWLGWGCSPIDEKNNESVIV